VLTQVTVDSTALPWLKRKLVDPEARNSEYATKRDEALGSRVVDPGSLHFLARHLSRSLSNLNAPDAIKRATFGSQGFAVVQARESEFASSSQGPAIGLREQWKPLAPAL
jgi:hypothetical protein